MIRVRTPQENLEIIFKYIQEQYSRTDDKTEAEIQFNLEYNGENIRYYLRMNNGEIIYKQGQSQKPGVTIECKYKDWLRLAGGNLNPIIGAITGKFKFKGDTSLFNKLLVEDDKYNFDVYKDPVKDYEYNPTKDWKKPENILVVNGSSNGENGYTYLYLDPLIQGMKESGSNVHIMNLNKKNIKHCLGCYHCWLSDTGECKIKDDMYEYYDKEENLQMIVFAFPLYFDGMPGLMKNFTDRLLVRLDPFIVMGKKRVRHSRRKKNRINIAMFSTSGFPGIDNFEAVQQHFKAISHNLHMPLIAEILRPEALNLYNNPTFYTKFLEVLSSIKQAGKELVEKGKISKKLLKKISQNTSNYKDFIDGTNMFWKDKIDSFYD